VLRVARMLSAISILSTRSFKTGNWAITHGAFSTHPDKVGSGYIGSVAVILQARDE